jgi:hypothetical protein
MLTNQKERRRWLRRMAFQIVVQLPEDERDALEVLILARALVVEGLDKMESGSIRIRTAGHDLRLVGSNDTPTDTPQAISPPRKSWMEWLRALAGGVVAALALSSVAAAGGYVSVAGLIDHIVAWPY